MGWRECLNRGLLPDQVALSQLCRDGEPFTIGHTPEDLLWPCEPLRGVLLRGLSRLGVAGLARKYPAVQVRRWGGVAVAVCGGDGRGAVAGECLQLHPPLV